ncbi:BglG family transcriptional regulator [Streptococcus pneumoniae]|nr:BglG family transcriptional regulator [Streptococcus pneumoniae]
MVLDKASCDLLQYLMDQETSKTIMAISKDLKESRRKIYPNFKLKLATQKKFTWRLVVQAFFRVVVNPIFDKSYFFRSRFLGSFR